MAAVDVDEASTAAIVAGLAYKPGWRFKLGGPLGRWLCVYALTLDSLAPTRERVTQHMREIPDGLAGREFVRWVHGFLLDVERHECDEFLQVDGLRPFFPGHGDDDPYEPREVWT